MNATTLKALFLDALYQVLDNWVFRILVVLTGVVVLVTFLVGFREEGIVFLFGVKSWGYADILDAINAGGMRIGDPQGFTIEIVVQLIFDYLAGNVGVIFCIAATSFFVPQMIEKGAADVLFHKPLPRAVFFLHRYFAGLLFVALLSSLMALGLYTGFALVSGWNDPGILLAAPLLTYLFGLIYAVAMLIGVVTRSTVAAILLTTVFFAFNGCIHSSWKIFEQAEMMQAQAAERAAREASDDTGEESAAPAEEIELEEPDPIVRVLRAGVSGMHYALPKASDADVIASKLRRAVNRPVFLDGEDLLAVFAIPEGMEEVEPELPGGARELEPLLGTPVFALAGRIDGTEVRATLLARDAQETEEERRGEVVRRRETVFKAGNQLRDAVEELGFEDVVRDSRSLGTNSRGDSADGHSVRWGDTEAVIVQGVTKKRLFTLWIDDESDDVSEERTDRVRGHIGAQMGISRTTDPYDEKFTFDAPWRYNILFSIGSSLAFVCVTLLLGWWRLTRIEF